MLEKCQMYGGPLDGLLVRGGKEIVKFILRKDKVVLVAVYEWSKDKLGYCYRKTYEPHEVPRKYLDNASIVNAEPRQYGDMYMPKPYNTKYKVYLWLPREM